MKTFKQFLTEAYNPTIRIREVKGIILDFQKDLEKLIDISKEFNDTYKQATTAEKEIYHAKLGEIANNYMKILIKLQDKMNNKYRRVI